MSNDCLCMTAFRSLQQLAELQQVVLVSQLTSSDENRVAVYKYFSPKANPTSLAKFSHARCGVIKFSHAWSLSGRPSGPASVVSRQPQGNSQQGG